MAFILQTATAFLVCFVAYAQPELRIRKIENGQQYPIRVQQTVEWTWDLNEDNVRVLGVKAILKFSNFDLYERARPLRRSTRVSLKGSELTLWFNSLWEIVILQGPHGKLILGVVGDFVKEDPVIDENCKDLDLVLRPVTKPVPFYLGTSCENLQDGLTFSLSYPKSAILSNSTLQESKGKGELWKHYELGPVKQALEQVGQFSLTFKKNNYDFVLESLKPKPTKRQPRRITLGVGLGYAILRISGDDIDVGDSMPVLTVRIPHYPFVGNLGAVLDLDLALPLTSGANAISYTQFGVYVAYEFTIGQTWFIRPKAGYVVSSQSHQETSVGIAANQPGFGLASELAVGADFYFTLAAMTCGFGAKSITGHYSVEFSLLRVKAGVLGWGFGAKLQSFSTKSAMNIKRKFDQMLFYGLLSF